MGVHEHTGSSHDTASHALGIPTLQGEHPHQIPQLEINSGKGHYLQERRQEERIFPRQVVEHGGNAERYRDNQGDSGSGKDGIEQFRNGTFGHPLKRGNHAKEKAHRQEHSVDDKKHL